MRKLVLLALIAGATGACQDAVSPDAPGGPALSSEASDRAHLDLREERASLISAGNAVSAAIWQVSRTRESRRLSPGCLACHLMGTSISPISIAAFSAPSV